MHKVLIVITKGEVGGAQMSVLNLAKKLKSFGIDVTVGFGIGDFLKNELRHANIPYYQFNYLKRTHHPLANLLFAFELKRYLQTDDFSVVHFNSSNSLFGALGAKLANHKIKTVFTFRGLSMLDKNYQINYLLKKLYFFFFKFFLLFINEKIFVSHSNFVDAKKMRLAKTGRVVYNGLNPTELIFLDKDQSRQELSTYAKMNLAGKFLIGTIGRLAYAKNYEFLINNFSKILKVKPNAILIIIGNGEERNKYHELIKAKKLEDKIFLLLELKSAYRFINGFDLFVLPSRYEGLSITLIEAIFSQTPILASRVGGNHEIVADDNQLFELDNIDDFIAKLKNITADTQIRDNAIAINHKQSENFNIDATAKNYLTIYEK